MTPRAYICRRCHRALPECTCVLDPHLEAVRLLLFPEAYGSTVESTVADLLEPAPSQKQAEDR
jgi:hypothetical protein